MEITAENNNYIAALNAALLPADERAAQAAQARWDNIAKPLGSLGLLESTVVRIAALTGSENISIAKRCVAMFCADNGVVAQGVTQTGSDVTAIVAANAAQGKSSVCAMARAAHADVFPIDVGMLTRADGVADKHIANGTRDFTLAPAMSTAQAVQGIRAGVETVYELKQKGYELIVTGEMGIGNTTTAAAMAAVLAGIPIDAAVGRGAGLNDAGLERKRSAIRRGIALNAPDKDDALDVLAKLGGFDIAAMAGAFIGGALYRVPIIIDGLISSVAALTAKRLCPQSAAAMLASHCSAEPAAQRIMQQLELAAPICANMRLGEGTGGVCLIPLIDMALNVYNGMATFEDINVQAYVPQGGGNK